MSGITGEFVAKLAQIWHRFALPADDAESLAAMLVPMDTAGEAAADDVAFDMEPADFATALEDLSARRNPR